VTLHLLAELRPSEIDERLAAMPAVVLPLGTLEWHSHHLPIGLDGIKAQALGEAVARATGALLAPTAWWAADGVPFPYTFRLDAAVVEPVLGDALVQFAGMGFRAICVVNGHYGLANSRAVRAAALRCMDETDAVVIPLADYEVLTVRGNPGDHAGTWETSLLWAARPDLVRLDAVGADVALPGVIGDDPRGRASEALGMEATAIAAAAVAGRLRWAVGATDAERRTYVDALAAGRRVLDQLAELRAVLPRHEVPPVLTPTWRRYLEAMADGRYGDALTLAEARAGSLET